MALNIHLPENNDFKPRIAVFGVGGAGGNAVNNMITANLQGVNFVVANTDAQALEFSKADQRIQLGGNLTRGLGAGASPDVGSAAAEESMSEILEYLQYTNMVFITAGMGGGTGTGAAPVIAKAARDQGILTVGVVTKPFHFEGSHRMKVAELGLEELQRYVDTLIVIPNQNLFRIANERTTFADAFTMADDVLHSGVRGVTDLIVMPGLINLDFADIRTVMSEMGKAMMGTGEAEGEKRALEAAEAAISNPLLDNVSMKGARGVLINITGGADMTLFEVDEAANRIREEVEVEANIIFGSTFNPELDGRIRVSVIATGIESEKMAPRAGYRAGSATKGTAEVSNTTSQNSVIESFLNDLDVLSYKTDQEEETPAMEEGQLPGGAATVRVEESVFISSRGEQAGSYADAASYDDEFSGAVGRENGFRPTSPAEEHPQYNKKKESKGFFFGMFGGNSKRQEQAPTRSVATPRVAPSVSSRSTSTTDTMVQEKPQNSMERPAREESVNGLDIPAYLRKK